MLQITKFKWCLSHDKKHPYTANPYRELGIKLDEKLNSTYSTWWSSHFMEVVLNKKRPFYFHPSSGEWPNSALAQIRSVRWLLGLAGWVDRSKVSGSTASSLLVSLCYGVCAVVAERLGVNLWVNAPTFHANWHQNIYNARVCAGGESKTGCLDPPASECVLRSRCRVTNMPPPA